MAGVFHVGDSADHPNLAGWNFLKNPLIQRGINVAAGALRVWSRRFGIES